MRITGAEVIRAALPFRETYTTASGSLDKRSMAILRLRSEDGSTGLGEAVPLSLRGGPGLEQVAAELERCGPELGRCDPAAADTADPAAVRAWVRDQLGSCAGLGAGPQALCAI